MSDPSPPAANLLEEPWIPVIPREGPPRDVGLHELLLHAGSFKGLNETAPPSLVALHRMLLALVHRALTLHHGPWKDADRKRWLRDGLPTKPLEAYLDQWQHRFWLFHPEFPFMQVPALATAVETKDKVKPWTQIALHAATGNTPTLFDHTMDGTPDAVPWPVVLRALLGFLQFTPGGLIKCFRSSDKAGPLANTAAVLLGGSTLGEGWLLGLHPYEAQNPHDLPAWERTPPTAKVLADEATVPSGINDRYTRLTRAVLLLPEADGRVGGIRFGAGLALGEDANALDPMACHRLNAEGKPIRITFTEGRATWRDLPALLPDASGKASLPPQVLAWATAIREEAASDVAVAGLASDQAKLLRWRTERFHLPMSLLTNPQQAQELRLLLSQTEEGYRKVRDLTTDLSARWDRIQVPHWLVHEPEHPVDLAAALNLIGLTAGRRFRFRLRANPSTSVAGKRIGILNEPEQAAWLLRKGLGTNENPGGHGFSIPEVQVFDPFQPGPAAGSVPQVAITQGQFLRGRKAKGQDLSVYTALFEGRLEVVDPDRFRQALAKGIGHGKALGLGLLSLVPLS